jgi:hypothetical protein
VTSTARIRATDGVTRELSGKVYHWKTGVLLEGVEVGVVLDGQGDALEGVTDTVGGYEVFGVSLGGLYEVSAFKAMTSVETEGVVSAADALAALKIAVGRNPNFDNKPVSPYQFIAADVNSDGEVTAADALAILKMAVGRADAPVMTWMFVEEGRDFWNEEVGGFATESTNVPRPGDLRVQVDPSQGVQANLVAVLRGDVNGSWEPAQTTAPKLAASYFTDLAQTNPNIINIAQFG